MGTLSSIRSGRTSDLASADVFEPSRTELYIRFADVDMMSVVHHGAYVHWLEQIRFHFLHDVLGVEFKQLVDEEVALPLTHCELSYKRVFEFGQVPVGYARVELYPQAKFKIHYDIFERESGALHTSGSTTHCFLGAGRKLLLRTPAFFASALETSLAKFPDCLAKAEEHGGR